jgi:hypothetical protein
MPQVTAGGITFTVEDSQPGDKFFYHPDGITRLAWSKDSEQMYADGWYDTPDDFPNEKAVSASVETQERVEIDDWSKDKLCEYAFEVFGVKLKKNFSQPNLVKQVKELENGNIQATD